jgi:hypothetical protein
VASLAKSRATKLAVGAARLRPACFLGVFPAFLTALYAQVEAILPPEYQQDSHKFSTGLFAG